MTTFKLYRILGFISVSLGCIAIALLFFPNLMPLAMPLVIMGFGAAGFNIYLNNKYEFEDDKKWPMGYVGMLINSLPIVFLLILIFKYR